jgi:hypothetical protein
LTHTSTSLPVRHTWRQRLAFSKLIARPATQSTRTRPHGNHGKGTTVLD